VGLGVARGDDTGVNGLVFDVRLADVRLVLCGRNLVAVVAWHEFTHQKPAFHVAVGDKRDFRLGPFEINRDALLAFFVIPHGHPLVFGGKFKSGHGASGLVDNPQHPECLRSEFLNRAEQPKFTL
jgi:acyl CoA:acetate/3-ketoacid CoA transferase beta subunit